MKKFVHLHTHTEFSPLDGLTKISDAVEQAEKYRMPALGITDHGTLAGVPELYFETKNKPVNPILGQEFYIVPDASLKDKNEDEFVTNRHIVLLALNERGWRTLVELTSVANEPDNYYYKPRIDYDIIQQYDFDNIAVLTACLNSEIHRTLQDSRALAVEYVQAYRDMFPHLYLELQRHDINPKVTDRDLYDSDMQFMEEQEKYNRFLLNMSRKFDIPIVITNDIHYTFEHQHDVHDLLLSMQTNSEWAETKRFRFSGTGYHLKSTAEMQKMWDADIWTKSQRSIEDICNRAAGFRIQEFETTNWHFPEIPGFDDKPSAYLKRRCYKRLKKLGLSDNQVYVDRLEHELKIIRNAKFEKIFIIVEDYVNWARKNQIIVGPGRGSMVGVLVSYLLGITEIDPVKYRLLFERAINPARPSIPDFDIDFENDRVEEVIDYVRAKYGPDNVMLIGTHLHMAPRMTMKRILRALGISFYAANKITSDLPENIEISNNKREADLDAYLNDSSLKELQQVVKKHDIIAPAAKAMLGLLISYGTHAAGVVISDKRRNIVSEVPLMRIASSDKKVSQYDMNTLKKLHLVKFDFLRLTTLKSIAQAINYIGYDPFVEHTEYDDADVFKMMTDGSLTTLFQYQGGAARQCIEAMGVHTFEDLVAVNALARPGAINFLDAYIAGKRAPERIEYPCEEVKPILEYTYGVILYQEQVMEIVKDVAGWDDLGADKIKEAIKSKSSKEFDEMFDDFMNGCVSNGVSKEVAEIVWRNIDDYRSYGFNRAHAVAYSAIGYRTAYLKHHYPKEWLTAVLNTLPDKNLNEVVDEARRLKIGLLSPNINRSDKQFTLSQGGIRFGLEQIRSIGGKVSQDILDERNKNGRFTSIEDFRVRTLDYRSVNKRVYEVLERSGAFSTIGGEAGTGQDELELLGTYVTQHPLNEYREAIDPFIYNDKNINRMKQQANTYVNWGGVVTSVKAITTKKGDPMAFVKLSYYGDVKDITFFPRMWAPLAPVLRNGDVMVLTAQKEIERNAMIANKYKVVNEDFHERLRETNGR